MFLYGGSKPPPYAQSPSIANSQKKKSDALLAFSFAYAGAKEKAIKKKTPISGFRALRSATRAACP